MQKGGPSSIAPTDPTTDSELSATERHHVGRMNRTLPLQFFFSSFSFKTKEKQTQ